MQQVLKQLGLSKFVAFDVETTGLSPENDAIIEFAAVLFENGKPAETLTFLCDPGYPIPPEITQLTGISTEMVQGKRSFEQHIAEVGDFLADLPLVGHNISFDLTFVRSYLKAARLRRRYLTHNALFDTALLAQAFLFFLHNHRLSTVAEFYQLSAKGAHRAAADALMTGNIFLRLIQEVFNYDYETLQTINMVLSGTEDPNILLYQTAAQLIAAGNTTTSKFAWQVPVNVLTTGPTKKNWPHFKPDEDLVTAFFQPAGYLAQKFPNFEVRPQQVEMAHLVYDTLNNDNAAIVEAGTGVGKSLAYLIPAILWVNEDVQPRRRVVVASNTKNLQEQIFYKEIPFIAHKLGLPFKAVLLKGRSNYICLTRWHRYLGELPSNLHLASRSAIIPIITWLKHTQTGDIAENNGFKLNSNRHIWNEICSEPGYCTSSICQKFSGCYLGRIREEAFSADVLVINHSLLLADYANDSKVLPEFQALIIDEAHNLEKNAYNYFAGRVNLPMLNYLLNSIYNNALPERGYLCDLQDFVKRHKLKLPLEPDKLLIGEKISDVKFTGEIFFRKLSTYKWTQASDKHKVFGLKQRYKSFEVEFAPCLNELNSFITELNNLKLLLFELKAKIDTIDLEIGEELEEIRVRLINLILRTEAYIDTLQLVGKAEDDELIFWYEINPNGKDLSAELVCTPLDVSGMLHDKLWDKVKSIVLTSATLRIASSFDYLLTRTGINLLAPERIVTRALGSPFRYPEQMAFFTFHEERQDYPEAQTAAEVIIRLSKETGRGILALFTSYFMLREVYQLCQPAFIEMGVTLLAQGLGGSRSAILEQFKVERNSVLLGTDSFWEGVDVIGEALEILVITKLPFPVPSEPIIEANSERIKAEGGDAFNDYYLPESVLKFRQGVGRLIRSINDYGVVVNLDNRIDLRRYGVYFKQSLPVEPVSVFSIDALVNQVQRFFRIGRI